MGSLYNKYQKLCLNNNIKNNAHLIYILASLEEFKGHDVLAYSIEKGSDMNQIWLYRDINNKGEVLLQATQFIDGDIDLSIQGLNYINSNIKNHIDYFKKDENKIFMEFLKYF